MNTTVPWAERARSMSRDGRCVIDGERRAAVSGESFDKHSPIDGRLLGPMSRGVQLNLPWVHSGKRLSMPVNAMPTSRVSSISRPITGSRTA